MLLCSFAITLILSASCTKAEQVHHAAVPASDGIIYIIGNTPLINNSIYSTTTSITTTTLQIDANHKIIPFQPSPLSSPGQQLILQGHKTLLKNEPVILFGTTITTTPFLTRDKSMTTPSTRHLYASSISYDNKEVYMVGGRDDQGQLLNDIWKLSLASMKWMPLFHHHDRGFAGHSTVLYRRWLISCFGDTTDNSNYQHKNRRGCTFCFDTESLVEESCFNHGDDLPLERTEAGFTLVKGDKAIAYGGIHQDNRILGDTWQLDLSQAPNLFWFPMKIDLPPRAGHGLLPFNSSTLLIYGGRLGKNDTPDNIEYLHFPTVQNPLQKRAPPDDEPARAPNQGNRTVTSAPPKTTSLAPEKSSSISSQQPSQTKSSQNPNETETTSGVGNNDNDAQQQQDQQQQSSGGLSGGAVAGLVIGILALLGIIGIFIWKRKQQRRRLRYFHNRASRFSLSTPPPSRPTSVRMIKTASLPEMSHIPPVDGGRLSRLSFGSDFQLPAHHQQQQRASYSSVSMPQSRFDTRTNSLIMNDHRQSRDIQMPEPVAMTAAQLRRQQRESSQSFKRLTLNIPSALRTSTIGGGGLGGLNETPTSSRDETTPSPSILKRYTVSGLADRRRSSMFGFRASRLLHIPSHNTNMTTPNSNEGSTAASSIGDEPMSRVSMDARSVSSVQWVGFNDSMDYREQQWNPTVQLAVTNQQRRSVSSSRPTSFAAESIGSSSSPRSAIFRFSNNSAHHSYRLSTQELHSWEDHINQRVLRTRNSNNNSSNGQGSSSSSLPSRAIERFNNYRVSTSSDESSLVITSGTAEAGTATISRQ